MDPINFGGQRSKSRSQWTRMKISCEPNTTKPLCASSSNLVDMLTMVNPIDFGGHSSKVKVMMVIIDKCGVRGDATLCVLYLNFFPPKKHRFYDVGRDCGQCITIYTQQIQRHWALEVLLIDNTVKLVYKEHA